MLQSRVKTQSRVLNFRWYFAVMAVVMLGLASSLTYQPAQAQGTNLALNKPANASSSENSSLTPNLAVDGNMGTRWSSAFNNNEWFSIDLGAVTPINRVVLKWEGAYGSAYQIKVSNDTINWTTIYQENAGNGGTDDLTVSGTGRYVGFQGITRATAYGYSFYEFQVYGGTTPTATPTTNPNQPFTHQVVTVSSSSAKIRFTPNGTSAWVDVHYNINNGTQQNVRMTNNNGTWEQLVTGLTNGQVINYFFTYEKNGGAYDSAWFNATFGSGSTATPVGPTATPVSPTATPIAPTATPASGWTLQWSDEFNAAANTGLNTNQWIYDIGHGYPGAAANWGTGEIAYHTNSTDNVYHDGNGNLAIKVIRTSSSDTGWTGGRVETQRADFQPPANGKMAVEGRLQLPNVTGAAAQGIWPAFWMLGAPFRPSYTNWPGAGEFDIMENVNGTNVLYGTFHCGVTPGGPCNETNGIGGTISNVSPSLQAAFHTYRFEFDKTVSPQEIRWYLDGVKYHTVKANQVDATTWNNATNHGFFIILNNTVGGGWPGNPTASTASGVPFLIDYVRVYYSN